MQWADSVTEHMTVDEVLRRYPGLLAFLTQIGYRESCRDCSLAALAHRLRLQPAELVSQINEVLVKGSDSERSVSS